MKKLSTTKIRQSNRSLSRQVKKELDKIEKARKLLARKAELQEQLLMAKLESEQLAASASSPRRDVQTNTTGSRLYAA